MLFRVLRSHVLKAAFPAWLAVAGAAEAHVVPSMTIEAGFAPDDTFTLRINVDPRTFLAADPTTLPPVPGSWYQEQTPAQITATQEKAREYLSRVLGLVFDGQKTPLPPCEIQVIDGADNTPLKAGTQEVHLLATAHGASPPDAGSFQIDFSKDANTTLILLQSRSGSPELRPQVVFPGETSRPFTLHPTEQPAPRPTAPQTDPAGARLWLGLFTGITAILLVQGWRLLQKHRHHHRWHQKPGQREDPDN